MNARRWSRRGGAAVAAACLLTACQTTHGDRYCQGRSALDAGDLARALAAFDAVPITDQNYPEARLAAAALERRLRQHGELVLLGLRLRGEWRDDEALAAFRGALETWPASVDTQRLLAATWQRRELLAALQAPSAAPPRLAGAGEPSAAPRDVPVAEPPTPVPAATPVLATEPPSGAAAPVPVPERPVVLSDEVGAALAQLELRMLGGAIDPVLDELLLLQQRAPGDPRVTSRLARLLQQRGLIRYGQGQVAAAVADLQRAAELDPQLDSARVLFVLAARELAQPAR